MPTTLAPDFDYSALGPQEEIARAAAERIKSYAVKAVESLLEIGAELALVKGLLAHGHFTHWLRHEFAWSERTARNYLSAADHFKTATVANLTASAMYLLSSPAVPESARDEAKQRAAAGEKITAAVAEAIREAHTFCPHCGGMEWGEDEDGRFCVHCQDPGDAPAEGDDDALGGCVLNAKHGSPDNPPCFGYKTQPPDHDDELPPNDGLLPNTAGLRFRRKQAADLQAETDILIAKLISLWPAEDWDDLRAWVKGVARQIKKTQEG